MKYATSWNVVKGLGVVGLRCPNHSLGGIALWRRAVGFTALPWRGDERPPDAGSRSVARREKGARLASGACARRGCFCSFALAVLAVLATAAPEQAAAQTVTTFISNTGQSANTAKLDSSHSVHHGHRHLHAVQRHDSCFYIKLR